jgi:hypothetical protein
MRALDVGPHIYGERERRKRRDYSSDSKQRMPECAFLRGRVTLILLPKSKFTSLVNY